MSSIRYRFPEGDDYALVVARHEPHVRAMARHRAA
jgi:hypothetical protein